MHRSLLPRYSPCIRYSPPVRVLQAYRSSVAVGRRPLNPRPSPDGESSLVASSNSGRKPSTKRGNFSRSPTKAAREGPRLARTGISISNIPDISKFFAENARRWTRLENLRIRLINFGIPATDIQPALSAFVNYIQKNDALSDLDYTEENIRIIKEDLADPESGVSVDVLLTRLFFEWAANPIGHAILKPLVDNSTLIRIANLVESTNLFQPAQVHEIVRAAPRRKIIMHVGPTNSGKTHNALRALAAAPTGVYCGPLRMLAFEIWERLNEGRIVPLGHDEEVVMEEDEDTVTDAVAPGEKPAMQKFDNPKFARVCNLITGDDKRVLDEHAPLTSCTVEMLDLAPYDVAVIDEIQLISDPDRGGSWTEAVLGVNAREVHLCGEESAVPLIKRLLEDVGDEVEVKRYERLTPLKVANHSLDGQLSRVQRGDCVVAFSRGEIYKLRDKIEQNTGLRCALAYGKLPAEVRSQQAELFNDLDSGYDVLVGSDAIGMGLNLKIKRMIFAQTKKWDGQQKSPISTRHLKQIAGRAGRFGLHGDNSSGGLVTSLFQEGMPDIRTALAAPIEMLRKARIRPSKRQLWNAASALPAGASLSMVPWLFHYVGKHHPMYILESPKQNEETMQHIDAVCGQMPVQMRMILRVMPLRWKDPSLAEAGYTLLRLLRDDMQVRLQDLTAQTGVTKYLDDATAALGRQIDQQKLQVFLQNLEICHGVLVAYIWLAYRLPISFPDREAAATLKDQVHLAMENFLAKLSTSELRSSKPKDYSYVLPVSPSKIKRPKSLRTKRKNHEREMV
ncbi:P-loop containing nucleoside triphosphate hydrolase protein [Irpex rosettiformis]|uniref:P-loop containing nucleoside triphosphate hydrolase protein n=1 Tax=Irpex rosettiformis TaxID=378272 RepID=A0ACB8TV68_9APHY|nr:P-loop containing nucleoside triphosphate hydrolase protein [Irpex rosettiformis]